MKRYGKASLIKELVLAAILFTVAMWYVGTVQQHNQELLAINKQAVSNDQAIVDTWLTKIHSDISSVGKALGLYNAYVAAHPDDRSPDTIGMENSLASSIYGSQFACQNLIEDYNQQKPKWPSYVHTETHSILECSGK